jgi:hypothetical protein
VKSSKQCPAAVSKNDQNVKAWAGGPANGLVIGQKWQDHFRWAQGGSSHRLRAGGAVDREGGDSYKSRAGEERCCL